MESTNSIYASIFVACLDTGAWMFGDGCLR
jgi:hypothetical protein